MKLGIPDSTEAGLAMMLIFRLWLSTFLTSLPQPLPCCLGRRKAAWLPRACCLLHCSLSPGPDTS